jgi:hypothetical protein
MMSGGHAKYLRGRAHTQAGEYGLHDDASGGSGHSNRLDGGSVVTTLVVRKQQPRESLHPRSWLKLNDGIIPVSMFSFSER